MDSAKAERRRETYLPGKRGASRLDPGVKDGTIPSTISKARVAPAPMFSSGARGVHAANRGSDASSMG